MSYSNKQRKKIIKMLTQTKNDIEKLEKKVDKIKLWLDIYETLLYATDQEDDYEEDTNEEETNEDVEPEAEENKDE
jgi:hypothetical protein